MPILEQPNILETFYAYISSKYHINSVDIVLKCDYLSKDPYLINMKKDEIVADFIASKIWGYQIVSSIPDYQERIKKVEILDGELKNGILNSTLQATTLV